MRRELCEGSKRPDVDRSHSDGACGGDVAHGVVPDEERVARLDPQSLEGATEDLLLGLRGSRVRRQHHRVGRAGQHHFRGWADSLPDVRHIDRLRWMRAVLGAAHHLISGSELEQDFGRGRDERDDAGGGGRESQRAA